MDEKPLTPIEMARGAGLHVDTIRRLERRGVIHARRDFRGWRAFPRSELNRLKTLLAWDLSSGTPTNAVPEDYPEKNDLVVKAS
jgi:DNA-binding transcriptional MerR regulator